MNRRRIIEELADWQGFDETKLVGQLLISFASSSCARKSIVAEVVRAVSETRTVASSLGLSRPPQDCMARAFRRRRILRVFEARL